MTTTRSRILPLAQQLDQHRSALLECRRCNNHPGITPVVSAARGPVAMLVGQAPGVTEQSHGRPFSGRAGRTLFKWLATSGLSEEVARQLLYFAAITRCYPGPHPAGRGDRVPSPRERKLCADWLDAEIQIVKPTVIIPVGRLAIDRFLGPEPLSDVVGKEHHSNGSTGPCVVIPLPHPSGASSWVHAPEHRALLEKSLKLIGQRMRPYVEKRGAA